MTISEQLDALFEPWNKTDTPGMVVGIVKNGALLYRHGFGMASLETGVANSPKTRMRIGSMSKHFTALLALLLAEDGTFDLDQPIRTYLPELTGPAGDPSSRFLLQHRGGSRCHLDIGAFSHGMAPPPLGAAFDTLAAQTGRNFAPGEAMIYCNGGYHLVSIAIERVTGASFEALLKQRLFDPVGMIDTASIPSDYVIIPGIATMHVPVPGGGWRRGLFISEEIRGEGAIVSTIDDMLRWTAHLRSRDRFGTSATWEALTDVPTFPDGSVGVYALGLKVNRYRGLRIVQHGGGVTGGTSQMWTFPDDGVDIVIMINGAPQADSTTLAAAMADIVLADRVGEHSKSLAAADYQRLLGDWWSAETGMVYTLLDDGGVLKLGICGTPIGAPIERTSDGRVVSPAGTIGEIEIALDEALPGGGLKIRFGGRTATYKKLSEECGDAVTFASALAGRYRSRDANAVAVATRDNGYLRMVFTDPYGAFEAVLHPLSKVVARVEAASAMYPRYAVITLSQNGDRIEGFHLNSGRTRHLQFNREGTG